MANSETSNSTVHILVVDDYVPWRQTVCSILKKRPELRVVGEVADGLAAVQTAQELKPDLILLDIGLPKLNGIKVATRLGHVAPATKVVFLTQNGDKDVVRAAMNTGAKAYVLKTDARTELLVALERVFHGDHYLSSGTCDISVAEYAMRRRT